MYRCTECQAEFVECPEFCDCGNDSFEEVYEQEAYQEDYEEEEVYYEPPKRRKPAKRQLTEEELEELAEEEQDKKKALITVGVSLIISLIILCCPPYPQKKSAQAKQTATVKKIKLPDVSAYWDNTLPSAFRKGDPNSNIPLLNTSFGSISTNMRAYLLEIGEEFSSQWASNVVDGSGEARIQFTINRDGLVENQKMIQKSRNESLDNSVLLLLSKIKNLEVPPADYKGERIILSFKVDGKKGSKVSYPTYK